MSVNACCVCLLLFHKRGKWIHQLWQSYHTSVLAVWCVVPRGTVLIHPNTTFMYPAGRCWIYWSLQPLRCPLMSLAFLQSFTLWGLFLWIIIGVHIIPNTPLFVFHFEVKPYNTAERLQNHFENSGGQPSLTLVLCFGKLPRRHRVGGELGDDQTNGGGYWR